MLVKLKAKVNLFSSEEQMEAQEMYDLGNVATSKEWVWRVIGIPVQIITKVIAFNNVKTLVYVEEGNPILVSEPFDEVFDKWRTSLYEYYQTIDSEGEEEEEPPTEEDLEL
jgi:hypothetical protein